MLTFGLLLGASVCAAESWATVRAIRGVSSREHVDAVTQYPALGLAHLLSGVGGTIACLVAAFR